MKRRVSLVPEWRRIMLKAWSVRLMVLAGALSGIEVIIPMLDGVVDIRHGTMAVLSGVSTCAALIARLVAQRSLNDGDASD